MLFRDIEATDADHAQILSIGPGRQSRIYRTADGGLTWERTFTNKDQEAFYDCMAMYPDGVHGLAMSDPVDGKFRIIRTEDGGSTWSVVSRKGMPKAVDGEFGFAASGTCLVTAGTSARLLRLRRCGEPDLLLQGLRHRPGRSATAGSPRRTRAGCSPWRSRTRRPASPSAATSPSPTTATNASAYGARTHWTSGGDLGGYRSGVAWLSGGKPVAVAVGPTGSDITKNGGETWKAFDDASFDAVMCAADGTCWASGAEGAVAILRR